MPKDNEREPAVVALEVAAKRGLKPARKKPLTFAVNRILKKHKFSPLSILVGQVFPLLPPEKQADICLKLMAFLYPQVNRADADGRKRKGPGVQTNVQVNVPAQQPQINAKAIEPAQPQFSLEDLLAIASDKKS